MNNTKKTKTTLAIASIFMAAILVVGTLATTTTTTKTALASNNSGNTVTAQINRQDGTQSGFDNKQEQQAQNTICTHPSSTCVSENEATATTTPVTGTGTLEVIKVVECKRTIISTCPPASDFTITVTGNNPTPRTFQGSGTGTLVTLGVGAYKVNEEPFLGFDTTFSADCTGTIAPGDQKTCIVTNTQQEP